MAIDTKAKRASVMAITLGQMLPPPTGVDSVGSRATVGWSYAGLAYGPSDGFLAPQFHRLWLLHHQIYKFN